MHGIMQELGILLFVNSIIPWKWDGTIDLKKAISIAESLSVSTVLGLFVEENKVPSPENFIKSIPHLSLFER
jgi:hypothetical protein